MAEAALEKLIEGNKRFLERRRTCPNVSQERLDETATSQNPFAVILTCSDSRVSEQLIFDCGVGDIFVVKVAGNVVATDQLGSVEFAVNNLGAKLILVLGHTDCGAVNAALTNTAVEGSLQSILNNIQPALRKMEALRNPKEYTLYNAVDFNAVQSAKQLAESPIIARHVKKDVYLMTAIYHVESGRVEYRTSLSF